jgi:RNA recognition motif-containing protein
MDKFTGKSKGFGFVEMSDNEAAKKAIAGLDETSVNGRTVKVAEAKPKEERPSGGRNFNNPRSYNNTQY